MIAIKNILIATDFSEASDVALNYGRALARHFDASVHVQQVDGGVEMASERPAVVERNIRRFAEVRRDENVLDRNHDVLLFSGGFSHSRGLGRNIDDDEGS